MSDEDDRFGMDEISGYLLVVGILRLAEVCGIDE
jgi:hypothetical protein